MTARIAPANAAAPMAANTFLPSFFFTALQISTAQAMQTAAATTIAERATVTVIAIASEVRTPRLALSPQPLPRFCPTKVVAASAMASSLPQRSPLDVCPYSNSLLRLSEYGGRHMPFSVIMAEISELSVTSKAGL